YLHRVQLVCELPDGQKITSNPTEDFRSAKLGAAIIKRNEEVAINFSSLPTCVKCDYIFVKVGGYYVPDDIAST
ncbi:hypothetical protein, partial [Stenotrophomonas maltophilia]|uniref:hypothetical protein n=1 Tax=Stenotrophomonas maltophilia TaxID=40324 RepID=UPI0031454EA9